MAHDVEAKTDYMIVRAWTWWFAPRATDPTIVFRERALRVLLPLLTMLRPLAFYSTYRAGSPAGPGLVPAPLAFLFFIVPIGLSYYALYRKDVDRAGLFFLIGWYLIDLASLPREGYWYANFQISLIIQVVLACLLLRTSAILPFTIFQLVTVIGYGAWLDANWYDPPLLSNGLPVTTFQRTAIALVAQELIIMFIVRFLRMEMEKYLQAQQMMIGALEEQVAERRAAEARYRLLFESSPEGILIFSAQGQIEMANPAACEMLGYTDAELHGQGPEFAVAPTSLQEDPISTERLEAGETVTLDRVLVRKDGAHLDVIGTARRMSDGRFQYLFRDISARRQAERALKERTAQLGRLNAIARSISTLQSLELVYESIYKQLRAALPVDAFMLCLYDAERNELSYPFVMDDGRRIVEPATQKRPGTLLDRVITTGEPALVNRSAEEVQRINAAMVAGSADYFGVKRASASYLHVPMIAQARVIGVMSAHSYTLNAFDETTQAFLSGVALQSAIAIENARLFDTQQHELAERSLTNEALRASEARQRALLEAIPELVFRIRRDGIFVDYHAPNRDQLLAAPELFLGQPVEAVMPPDVADKTRQAIDHVLQTGQVADFEYSLFIQEQVQYFEAHMVISGQDEVLITVRDITERKQSEKVLQQRLHELAVIHAVSQAAASQLELDALFDLIAQELLHLFDIQEVFFALHDRQTDLIQFPYYRHGDRRLETEPVPLGQGLSSTVILSRQPLLINQDYERRSAELGVVRFFPESMSLSKVSWLGVPIQAGEQVIGVICMQNLERENAFTAAEVRLLTTIATNVGIAIQNAQLYTAAQQELAERKRIQLEREKLIAELEAKNAELERFTYTVSHDLKSPLVTIRGFLGYLEKDAAAGDLNRFKADMNRIAEATDRMQRLLSELLELSRIGRMVNPSQVLPFETLVCEAIELVRGRIDARGVQVEVLPNLPVVYGDRARLVEVMQNLIDNACKYMGNQPEPRITIGLRETDRDGRPIVCVRDNGLGIDPAYHDKVFGLFDKLDPKSEGTGIGLALVKRIIEVHGGRIWVESDLGQGAAFCFTLDTAGTQG